MNVFSEWKRNLLLRCKRFLEAQKAEEVRAAQPIEPYVLNTNAELRAYVAGVAAAFSTFLKRGVTHREVEETIHYGDYVGGAWLTLCSLEDWGAVNFSPRVPDGEPEFPLKTRVLISTQLRRTHNHSICCPGCDRCSNFIRKAQRAA